MNFYNQGRKSKIRGFANARIDFQAELDELKQLLRGEPDNLHEDLILAGFEPRKNILDIIRKIMPD